MDNVNHSKLYDTAKRIIERGHFDVYALEDAFDLTRSIRSEQSVEVDGKTIYDEQSMDDSMELSRMIRSECAGWAKSQGDEKAVDIYRRTLLFDAPHDFDAYCRYLEWYREPKKRFYEPRRKQLKPIVDALQDLEDGRLELLTISTPPGVGKTSLGKSVAKALGRIGKKSGTVYAYRFTFFRYSAWHVRRTATDPR